MAINPIGGAGPASISGATGSPKVGEGFGKVMKGQTGRLENAPMKVQDAPRTEAKSVQKAEAGKCRVEGAKSSEPTKQVTATKVLDQVNAAQNRMEQILQMAESGKSFSPAELLSLQTHVYRASQELDLAGKVVEKATGGVKQVLQTQV
jgi:hypothetical protein